jgi:hypothetical protein
MMSRAKEIMGIVSEYWYPRVICSEACLKFIDAMKIFNVRGRMVALSRPSTHPLLGHSVCELYVDDKWVCFDVAFDFTNGCSVKELADDPRRLSRHPIWFTHNDELIELYKNYTNNDY